MPVGPGHRGGTQHPFFNGNKRTGFEVVQAFLEPNGYRIGASVDQIYSFLSLISSGRISLVQVEDWMETNLAEIG